MAISCMEFGAKVEIVERSISVKRNACLLLEMCHIAGNDDAINLRIDLENLSKIYYPVIK